MSKIKDVVYVGEYPSYHFSSISSSDNETLEFLEGKMKDTFSISGFSFSEICGEYIFHINESAKKLINFLVGEGYEYSSEAFLMEGFPLRMVLFEPEDQK